MVTYTLQPSPPLAADGGALTQVLDRAGVTKDSVVRVTGPAGLIAVIWLCRHGYEHAAYVQPKRVATMMPADVLLVPHACPPQELAELLQGGGCLREGGLLIVQASTAQAVQGGDRVLALLESLGYRSEHHLSDKGRDIHIARRLGSGGFKKAA